MAVGAWFAMKYAKTGHKFYSMTSPNVAIECGLGRDGQCSMAGSEHCDFCCPNRNSEFFAGSKAWRRKHGVKYRV